MKWRAETFSLRYQLLFPAYAHLPPAWAYRLARWHTPLFQARKQAEAAQIRLQMQQYIPQASSQQLDAWLAEYFCMVEQEALDTWYLQHQPIEQLVELKGFEKVIAASQAGQRVILASGHFGRFWMAGPAMRAQGHSTGTITRDGGQENVHGLHPAEHRYRLLKLQRLQQVLGGPFLVEGGDIRPLYKALDEHLIALIFDVPYPEVQNGGVTAPFIGGSIDIPAGIYRIATKTKAVIAPFFMRDLGSGRTRAEFSDLLNPSDYNETALMQVLASQLKQRILEDPGQWWLWAALPLLRSKKNNESVSSNSLSG